MAIIYHGTVSVDLSIVGPSEQAVFAAFENIREDLARGAKRRVLEKRFKVKIHVFDTTIEPRDP